MERLAIFYSDGSFNVHPDGWSLEKIVAQCEHDNGNVTKQRELARVARVRLEVIDDNVVPIRPAGVHCKCGKSFKTVGGIEECIANDHA